jgi:catechol 2,3-dioxygenase-like lactoylglutathione lyase family enzyme
MFGTAKAFGSFAVDDLAAAQKFYGETLGLRVSEEGGALMLYLAGDHRILVYPKPDHSPASFTVLNFPVDEIDQAIDELTARGVPIQRYEGIDTDDKGIYRGERRSIAWFTDPAGNVLSVVQETERPSRDHGRSQVQPQGSAMTDYSEALRSHLLASRRAGAGETSAGDCGDGRPGTGVEPGQAIGPPI